MANNGDLFNIKDLGKSISREFLEALKSSLDKALEDSVGKEFKEQMDEVQKLKETSNPSPASLNKGSLTETEEIFIRDGTVGKEFGLGAQPLSVLDDLESSAQSIGDLYTTLFRFPCDTLYLIERRHNDFGGLTTANTISVVHPDQHSRMPGTILTGDVIYITNNAMIAKKLIGLGQKRVSDMSSSEINSILPAVKRKGNVDYILEMKPARIYDHEISMILRFRDNGSLGAKRALVKNNLLVHQALDQLLSRITLVSDPTDVEQDETQDYIECSLNLLLQFMNSMSSSKNFNPTELYDFLGMRTPAHGYHRTVETRDGMGPIKKKEPDAFKLDSNSTVRLMAGGVEHGSFSAVIDKLIEKIPVDAIVEVRVGVYQPFFIAHEERKRDDGKNPHTIYLASNASLLRNPGHQYTLSSQSKLEMKESDVDRDDEPRFWMYQFCRGYDGNGVPVYAADSPTDKTPRMFKGEELNVPYHIKRNEIIGKSDCQGLIEALIAVEELYESFINLSDEKNRQYLRYISRDGK